MQRGSALQRSLALWALQATIGARRADADDLADRAPEEVVVRDAKAQPGVPLKDPSVAGSVVRADRLDAPGLQLADVLRSQPGVAVTETGGFGSLATASVRGATSAQTPVYLGNVRINDDVGGAADLSLLPLWLIRRIEIYRGNAPIEADQLGVGGAIFLEPQRPTRSEVTAGEMAGSYGMKSGWTHAAVAGDRGSALVGVRVEEAKNDYPYVDDHGERFERAGTTVRRTNADEVTFDVWSAATLPFSRNAEASLLFNAVERTQGVPGPGLVPTRRTRATTDRTLAALTTRSPCDREGRCLVTATSTAVVTRSVYDDPLQELGLGTTRVETRGARSNDSVSVRLQLLRTLAVQSALHLAGETLSITQAGFGESDSHRMTARAATTAQWAARSWLVVRGLVAIECNGTSHESEGKLCTELDPSGRIGLQVGSNSVVALANLGRYVRVPTLGELYGISGSVLGSAGLAPERGVSVDAGVRLKTGAYRWLDSAFLDAFAFLRGVQDLIAYQQSALGYLRPYNVGEARVSGLEVMSGVAPRPWALVGLNATFLDPRNTTPSNGLTNNILPYRSRLILAPEVAWQIGPRCRSTDADRAAATVRARYVYQSSRYADSAGLIVIPAQGSLDLEGEVAFARYLGLRLRVADVLNQPRFDLIGYPLPGRSLYAALEGKW